MSKQEFLQTYVLNRAAARPDPLCGEDAAREAINAWDALQSACSCPPDMARNCSYGHGCVYQQKEES